MPIWLYQFSPVVGILVIFVFIETLALLGLMLVRRFLIQRLKYNEGVHEAVSGTVQAIGVFYGITVGLIAAGVWNTYSNASDLVSKEAASIGSLYRDVGGYPSPIREELRSKLREYTVFVINEAWPAQKMGRGQTLEHGVRIMDDFAANLYTFQPSNAGESAVHNETLRAFNTFHEYRRLRIDAVGSGLSPIMWAVIWVGAAISIGVAYFYKIPDWRLHAILIGLMGGFLAMVIFMIIVNDKPFFGYTAISPDAYKLILERLIDVAK
jgi:Protein of unknown function (DUF4239)